MRPWGQVLRARHHHVGRAIAHSNAPSRERVRPCCLRRRREQDVRAVHRPGQRSPKMRTSLIVEGDRDGHRWVVQSFANLVARERLRRIFRRAAEPLRPSPPRRFPGCQGWRPYLRSGPNPLPHLASRDLPSGRLSTLAGRSRRRAAWPVRHGGCPRSRGGIDCTCARVALVSFMASSSHDVTTHRARLCRLG